MKIKSIVCFLIMGIISIIGVNFMYCEEILVFHDRQSVYVLSTSPDGGSIKKELINDAYAFDMNENGYFTMKDGTLGAGTWYKGKIDSSFNVTRQALSSIPPDVTTLTLSEDGKLVAWVQSEGYWKSELTIEEYVGDKMKVLRKISVDGMIPKFSFSPNSDLLAYFYGPPEAHLEDGFSLMLLDMKNPEKPPVEIAPPSLNPGYMNPSRSIPPVWSPEGKYILFQARYNDEEPFGGGIRYIVSIDDRTLVLSPSGRFGEDKEGKYFTGLEEIGDTGSGKYILTKVDVSSPTKKSYIGDELNIGVSTRDMGLSPSRQKIIYIVNGEVFVYDIAKKATTSYGTSQHGRSFFWLSPKD